ncbi:MAG: FtsX-like permease family protein [Candidatus Shapirobacteria bacterium]
MTKKRAGSIPFVILVLFYFLAKFLALISRNKINLKIPGSKLKTGSISQVDLLELSIRNLVAKKNRTIITIGGMTIGIAVIVFLVSLGYGLQELVVKRVARLEEMSQADVMPQTGGKLKINDQTLNQISSIKNIKAVLPLISVVGRVSYSNSVSDMAVYGITSNYLKQSAIKPIYGKIFESNDLVSKVLPKKDDKILVELSADEASESANVASTINYSISSKAWIKVRENADPKSKILGYTKKTSDLASGIEISGTNFVDIDGKTSQKWIKSKVLLWKMEKCDENEGDCENGEYMVSREKDGSQSNQIGYFGLISEIKILDKTVAVESEIKQEPVSLSDSALKKAVVNKTFLKVLGIKENEAVGKKFTTTFVVVGNLLSKENETVESVPTEYEIIGVTPDEKSPIFFVPFIDLRGLGVENYSQIKIVANNGNDLPTIRQQIEAMGYITSSVSDTVAQINSLFSTLRTMLALLGLMALSVAALGMFNTLTVSLMERTREVGLMKAMGMKSYEVRELFLAESLIMGLCGGVFGLILGFLMGKLLGLILSIFPISKGIGFIDISYIPIIFVILIIVLSLLIGILTGIYPAKRATKISALNALRYE